MLVLGEVGMDPHSYFLAFARLARRSVLFWGHAVTSGITRSLDGGGCIGPDYFVSSSLFEAAGDAAQVTNPSPTSNPTLALTLTLPSPYPHPTLPSERVQRAAAADGGVNDSF